MTEKSKSQWSTPSPVSDTQIVFGGNIDNLLPAYDDIPEEFKNYHNPWVEWQTQWFFWGLSEEEIPKEKEGIDKDMAIRHLKTIQGSFAPQHEHKQAGVAYLASLWFKEPPALKRKSN